MAGWPGKTSDLLLCAMSDLELPDEPQTRQRSIQHTVLGLLARREHSRLELQRKLRLKGFNEEQIEAVLEDVVAQGLQSDRRYAESYIRFRSHKGYGPQRIRLELKERGVDATLVDEQIQIAETDWFEMVVQVKQKKFGTQAPADMQAKAKVMRYLQYRGFSNEQIRYALGD